MSPDCIYDLNRGQWTCVPIPWLQWLIFIALVAVIGLLLRMMSEREELRILREQRDIAREILELIRQIIQHFRPRLSSVRLSIGGSMADPITLNVGDIKKATLQGFDQFGQSIALDPASISYSDDNPAVVSSSPQADGSDDLVALTAGVANIAGSSGGFSDSIAITVAQPAPKLASVKLVVA